MKTKIILTVIFGAVLLTALQGCSLLKKRVSKTEKVEYKVDGTGKTSISVDNTNGRINVSRSKDTLGVITIKAEKTAYVKYDEQDEPIRNVEVNIDSSGNELKIETEITSEGGLFRKHRSAKVNYDIEIPANLNVKVETVNGTITLSRIDNEVIAHTVNGSINVYSCPGELNLESVNGKVTCNVDSLTNGINVNVVNGTVKIGGLKNVNADVEASTVNGRVKFYNLNFSDLVSEKKNLKGKLGTGGSRINISAINGSVTFDADKFVSKKINSDDDFEIKIDIDDDEPVRIIEKDRMENYDHNDEGKQSPKSDSTDMKKADSLK